MRKQIDFLNRLFEVYECRVEILDFLKQEKLVSDDEKQTLLHENHTTHSTRIAVILNELKDSEKLQLVSYEWSVLPKEFMKLTLVAENDKKEFIYSV